MSETPPPPSADPLEQVNKILEAANLTNAAAERMEKANAKREELFAKQEQANIDRIIGGQASAGSGTLSEDEKSIASARKVLEGTGFEDMFDSPKTKI
jgi:hypothetical protein